MSASEVGALLGDASDLTSESRIIPHSSDRQFDRLLAETLVSIADCLNVNPSFTYYDDYDGPNAFASDVKRVAGTDGTVLFGQRYLKQVMDTAEAPDAAIAGICAHEFGHILQYKLGLDKDLSAGQPTVKRVELNADFFAGYFAGMRKRQYPAFNAAAIALAQFNAGDNMLNNPAHHGTAEERGKVIVKGYQTSYNDQKHLLDAIKIGVEFVMKNF